MFNSKSAIDIRLESRNSFITNKRAKITGVRIGVSFQKKLRMGGGLSWLETDITDKFTFTDEQGHNATVLRHMELGYVCYYVDVVFHKTKRWQLSVPLQLGTGASWFRYHYNAKDYQSRYYLLLLYEPGISVQWKAFRWIGAGADVNYRFVLKSNKYVGERLSSPTYAFKLLFWIDQLYYELFPKSKLSKRFGPAQW